MKLSKVGVFCFLFGNVCSAQVGINTSSPDASAAIDIRSGTIPMGMLTPRMTTTEKMLIGTRSTPLAADGLIVYDTDLKSFFHWNISTNSWVKLNSGTETRSNFKRIQSIDVLSTVLAQELIAGGGSKYQLNTNTLYEINGVVNLDFPINLNNAYIQGVDSGDDVLVSAGNIFDGNTGGTIKGLTMRSTSGSIFNLNGTAAQNLIFRDCIIANSASVGNISNFGLVFSSVVQYSGNATGITYNNISQLLLSNMGWFGNNTGIFERLTGSFSLVQKQGGFSEVNGTATGFDVSAATLNISGDAVMEAVVFTGNNPAGFVNKTTNGNNYLGYNFNNSWTVHSAGIPTESDATSTGDFGVDYAVGSGVGINVQNTTTRYKVPGVSESTNLFRFQSDNLSKLTYIGKKRRIFQISGSISFQVPAAGTYIVYIAKNGVMLEKNKVYGRGTAASDIVVLPLNASAELTAGDFVEVYIQRFAGSNGNVVVPNMSLTIK